MVDGITVPAFVWNYIDRDMDSCYVVTFGQAGIPELTSASTLRRWRLERRVIAVASEYRLRFATDGAEVLTM